MSKKRPLSESDLREQEEFNTFYKESMKNKASLVNDPGFTVGEVYSPAQDDILQQGLEKSNAEYQEKFRKDREDKSLQPDAVSKNPLPLDVKDMVQKGLDKNKKISSSKPADKSSLGILNQEDSEESIFDGEFMASVEANNEEVKQNGMNTYQKLIYTQVDPKKQARLKEIEELEKQVKFDLSNKSSYGKSGGVVGMISDFSNSIANLFSPGTKEQNDRLAELNKEKMALQKPATEMFARLVDEKLRELDAATADESFVISDAISAADYFLRKSSMLANSSGKDSGFWRNLLDTTGGYGVAGSVSNVLGAKEISSMLELYKLSNRVEKIKDAKELSPDDIRLLEAFDLYQSSLNLTQSRNAEIGQGVGQTVPFMIQMLATRGIGAGASRATEATIRKALVRFGVRGAESSLAKTGASLAAKKAVPALAGSLAAVSAMPATYADIAGRYAGELELERDEKGNIDKAYMKQSLYDKVVTSKGGINDQIKELQAGAQTSETKEKLDELLAYKENLNKSLGRSIYEGVAANTVEVLTERIGGEFIANKLAKAGFKMPSMGNSRAAAAFRDLKKGVGFDGFIPEYIEELMVTPMNAALVGDSKYSDLWDGQQQLNTALTVAATSGLMGIPGAGISLSNRIRNKEFYRTRKETLNKIKEIQKANPSELSNLLNTGNSLSDIQQLRETQDKLRNEGKLEEANLLGETLVYNQALAAFKTGTSEEFISALDEQINKDTTLPEDKASLVRAKAEVGQLKRTYDKFSSLPNIGKIMELQTNKLFARRGNQELDKKLSEIELDARQDIIAYAEANNIEVPPFTMGTLFTETFEDSEAQDKYNGFVSTISNAGLASVNQYEMLSYSKGVISQLDNESRILFNEQISPEYQKSIKTEQSIMKDFEKYAIRQWNNTGKDNNLEMASEDLDKIAKKYKGKISDNRLDELKEKAQSIMALKTIETEKQRQQLVQQASNPEEDLLNTPDSEESQYSQPSASEAETADESPESENEIIGQENADSVLSGQDNTQAEVFMSDEALNRMGGEISQLAKEIDVSDNSETGIFVMELNEDDFYDDLPKSVSETQKETIKSRVASAYNIAQDELGKNPTFEEFLSNAIRSRSRQEVEEYFNVFAMGWSLNDFPKADYKKVYNRLFNPLEEAINNIMDSSFIQETESQVFEQAAEVIDKANIDSAPVIGFDEMNVPIKGPSNEGFTTITPNLKLGFLAVGFTQSLDEDRNTVIRTDSQTELNNDSLVDFKRLLDPDRFNKGTVLGVGIVPAETLENVKITQYNEDGTRTSLPYNTWLASKIAANPDFRNTQEFTATVPIMAYDSTGTPVAYIHDVNWYNPTNIGPASNESLQTMNINEGRENVLQFREQVVNGNVSQITIDSKEGSVFTVLPDADVIPLSEANPQSVVVVATKKGIASVTPSELFENSSRIIINKDTVHKGGPMALATTYDLRRVGTNEQGQQTYIALPVFNGTQVSTDTEIFWAVNDDTFTTMGKAFLAYLRINDRFSYANKKGQVMDMETAGNIMRNVLSATGYDISNRDDLRTFFQQYSNKFVKDFDFGYMADIFFNPQSPNYRKVDPNVSLNAMETNAPMVNITENNDVIPLGTDYQGYLKQNLTSNVKSYNIGTEQEPKYVTAIQPSITFSYNVGVTEKAVEATTETIKEEVKAAAVMASQIVETGNSELDILNKANSLLANLGFISNEDFDDLPNEITDTRKIQTIFNTTPGLNIMQEFQIVDFIFNSIAKSVGFTYKDNIGKDELLNRIKTTYQNIAGPSRSEVSQTLRQLETLDANKYPQVEKLKQDMIGTLDKYKMIEKNWKNIEDKALEKLYKYTGIKDGRLDEDAVSQDTESQREKDYSKTSLEENGKSKTSYRLRRFMAGIQDRTPNGEVKKGFLNVPAYVGFNEVYDTVAQILSSPVEIESNFDLMVARLSEHSDTHTWLPELIEKLENADQQIKKEFVYNYTKHSLSMKFAMYNVDGKGNYNLKIYDTNAHEITRLIREQWRNNFIFSNLVNKNDINYNINKVYAQSLLDEFNSWQNPAELDSKTAMAWLAQFGIVMSDDAFDKLRREGMYNMYTGNTIAYQDMFNGANGVFGLLHNYLKRIADTANTEFEENENNHPYTDMSGILNGLSLLESKFTNQSMTLSFRDNGKAIFGLTPNKFVTDRILKLKQYDPVTGENPLVDQLQRLSMSQASYMLELLNIEPEFRGKFQVDHNGITSLKQQGRKSSPFSGITDLTSTDHDIAKLTGFQDTKQGTVRATVDKTGNIVAGGNGISMRIGRMFLPTMSDKSQMLMLSTAVFNLFKDKNKAFSIDSQGNFEFSESLGNLLFNQLVWPELNRISKYHLRGKTTNVKDYDNAAQIFNFIPALNTVADSNGINLIELMANNPETFTPEYIEDNFKADILEVIKSIADNKVNEKIDLWESITERKPDGTIKKLKFFDSGYLDSATGTLAEKQKLAAYDFVLNSFMSNANMFTIIAGDPAIYSQDKLFSGFKVDNTLVEGAFKLYGKEKLFRPAANYKAFKKNMDTLLSDRDITAKMYDDIISKIRPMVYSGNINDYTRLSKQIGVNIGKRLALLIAPGNKIADSKNAKYMQIFMKDAVHISENALYLIELYYGKGESDRARPMIDMYAGADIDRKNSIRASLADAYPSLGDYFDIESTDAQEYTTALEHITILEGQGRISSDILQTVKDKIKRQKISDRRGLPINPSDLVTKEELDIVFQPIKPVHTGQVIDEEQDIARTVYVKSSSFPLLPQFTKGRELDALRLKLEELEEKYQMPVRASYQTANKVGAMNNPINPFNEQGLANAENASLILDRDNFRIQQDVPFKSDMKKEDKVSMGTQIFKLLFGDGMINQTGFMLDGKEMTGRELYDHFNEKFKSLIAVKKKQLFQELELNNDGTPKDSQKSFAKLQDMLQREARDRGYPRQDIEALSAVTNEEGEVIPLYDVNGNEYYDFKLPLWISANSNRYEALLNAIVTNRIIAQKMPGNAYVVGSEEGMKVSEDTSLAGSRIIHVGDFQGGELKGTQLKDGTFTYAEVYVPSKFKDVNGKLIDMYKKDRKGEYVYLTVGEKGEFRLKNDMIEQDLLSMFSFRTPTSSHVSASIIKIAGILPPENGDLMIVPKNFTKQKGLDFDVDKETAYTLWNRVLADGRIKTLDSQDKAEILAEIEDNMVERVADLTADDPFNNMMQAIFGEEEYNAVIEDEIATKEEKIARLGDKLEQKLLENEFVKVHKAVFANPSPAVQAKINKVLSMDFAKSSADFIEGLNNQNSDDTSFTILSDEYQKSKMALGAAGKLAIGVYSNYVTFHGLTQQTPIEIGLVQDKDAKGFQFGDLFSNGKMGNEITLDGERSIAEAFAEKQNTATDNEKEQILGRVNVNGTTINVDSLMTLLGFDSVTLEDGKKVSLSYLFLSQPILREYVSMIENSKAITADFVPNREQAIIEELINKYSGNIELDELGQLKEEDFKELVAEMTGDKLVSNITEEAETTPGMQLAVLRQFLELNTYAREVGGLQGILNTTDLGKSIAESNDKYSKLEGLSDNDFISNGHSLIGNYIAPEQYDPEVHSGYMRVGDMYILPTTPQGQIVVNGIKTGNDLWNKYFLYSSTHVQKVTDSIFEIVNAEEKSDNRKIELRHTIMKEIKKYFNSYNGNGIFTDKASIERERLFIDTEGHKSLARYLNEIKLSEIRNVEQDSKRGVYNIKKNRLLNKFEFQLNSNGEPSLVKFNNNSSENFDEDYLYTAIAEMVINNDKLPDMNGEPYTTRKLAADLVTYAFVEGGVQEAIQFMKYVPVEYLETVGFTSQMQNFSTMKNPAIIGKALGVLDRQGLPMPSDSTAVYKFVKQFIQHNPQMATQYPEKDQSRLFKNTTFDTRVVSIDGIDTEQKRLSGFDLVTENATALQDYPKFISVKTPTKLKRIQEKFGLFQHTGNGSYQRISILGMNGMNEYELGNSNATSLLDLIVPEPIITRRNVVSREAPQETDPFNISGGNIEEILNLISNSKSLRKYKHLGKVASFLNGMMKDGIQVRIEDTSEGGKAKAAGRTLFPAGQRAVIIIDSDTMATNSPDIIARTFIHEAIHAFTSRELLQYFDRKTGEQKVSDLPPHIARLKRIYEQTRKQLGPELDALIKKRQSHLGGELPSDTAYSAEDLEVTYAGTSIFEFVTTALTEPEFMKRMNEVPFSKTGNSLWEAFKAAIANILYSAGIKMNREGITFEALSSAMDFINIENLNKLNDNQNKSPNFGQSMNQNDAYTIAQIEKDLKNGMQPIKDERFRGLQGLDLPLNDMINIPYQEC